MQLNRDVRTSKPVILKFPINVETNCYKPITVLLHILRHVRFVKEKYIRSIGPVAMGEWSNSPGFSDSENGCLVNPKRQASRIVYPLQGRLLETCYS